MGYSARTLVDLIAAPAALVDANGLILVTNDRWERSGPQRSGDRMDAHRLPADDADLCGALLDAVAADRPAGGPAGAPAGGPPVLRQLPGRTVRVVGVRCDCGAANYLVSIEPAADLAVAERREPAAEGGRRPSRPAPSPRRSRSSWPCSAMSSGHR
jgi:hypothetical protein